MNNINKYYEILGLKSNASQEEVKQAYFNLAKKWHPDHFINHPEKLKVAEKKFQEINEAYEIIKTGKLDVESVSNSVPNKDSASIYIKKNNADIYYDLGVIAAENNSLEEAINYFSAAIKVDKNFINAYYYRGAILDKQGFQLRAESDFNKAKELKIKQNFGDNFQTKLHTKKQIKIAYKNYAKKSNNSRKTFLLSMGIISLLFILLFTLNFTKKTPVKNDFNQIENSI
jgi:curved DNA-binding protein CbpA